MKKTVIISSAALAVIAGLGCDRLPSYTQWERRYAGPDGVYPFAIIRAPDSGYAAVSEIRDHWTGATGVWLLRLDEEGDTLWARGWTIGQGTTPDDILITRDGEYCVAGRTDNPRANTPFVAVVERLWGGLVGCDTWPELRGNGPCRVAPADSGALMMACETSEPSLFRTDIQLQRMTKHGYIYWSRHYTLDSMITGFRDLAVLSGGAYCLVGNDWAMGVSRTGDSLWFRDYRALGSVHFLSAEPTADSGLVLAGSVYTDSGAKIIAVKTSSTGELIWNRRVDVPPSAGWGTCAGEDGSNYVLGEIDGVNTLDDGDGIIVKLNPEGEIEWQRVFRGTEYGPFVSAVRADDGDLLVLGYGGDGLCMLKMAP